MENKNYAVNEDKIKALLESGILSEENRIKVDTVITDIEKIYATKISEEREEREKQYSEYRTNIESIAPILVNFKYNFQLSKKEYLDLKKIILTDIEYNRENLFIGLVVRDNFFRLYDESTDVKKTSIVFEKAGEDNTEYATFELDINEITRLSHLTGLYTIKNLNSPSADNFSEIVRKVGEITQIYNHYSIKMESLSENGGNWIQGFEVYDEKEEIEAEKID